MGKIICDGVDVTEHVAAMYDALVGSMDWGSGFLDTEDVESILIVAHLAGFSIPESNGGDIVPQEFPPERDRKIAQALGCESPEWAAYQAECHRLQNGRRAAIVAWRAQVKAKADALRDEAADGG